MTKIVTLKFEVTASDDATVADVRDQAKSHLRKLGTVNGIPGAGQTDIECQIYFGAADVKIFQPGGASGQRKPKATASVSQ